MVLSLVLQSAPVAIDTDSAVSLGLLLIAVGGVIRISALLSRIEEQVRRALQELAALAPVPSTVALLDQRVARVESDIDELWSAHRDGDGRKRIV